VIQALKKILHQQQVLPREKNAADAYDLWSQTYDVQPGNLMLDFDEEIFCTLLSNIDITGKYVADVGCGTGRHWHLILNQEPAYLHGFDVSKGMLEQLRYKFPEACLSLIEDNQFAFVEDALFDVIISTLTIAHIVNIEEAISAWSRILKAEADLIITDFHPSALAIGGKRTFSNNGKLFSIANYIHPIERVEKLCKEHGFEVVNVEERIINEKVTHYYAKQNALHVFNRFKGSPIIYGLHLRRTNDIK
jgi:ubiquinone/menaquinone biosynthesis C-methylase UbiE